MPEHQQIQQSKKTNTTFQKQATPISQTPVSNPYSIIQRAKINPKSLTHADIMQLQRTIGNRAVGRLLAGIGSSSTDQQAPVQRQEIPDKEDPLQGKMADTIQCQEIPEEEESIQSKFKSKPEQATCSSCSTAPVQREDGNRTGMPDNLKSGMEQLSGMDLSDVRVHYNSDKPITAGALAYAQGNDIYLGPGQDMHLPHEVWHVVQQAHGRVRPTLQLNNLMVNDNVGLETEADVMGERAVHTHRNMDITQLFLSSHRVEGGNSEVVQCDSFLKKVMPGILGASALLYGISELFSTDTAGSDSSDQSHGLMNISPTTLAILSGVAGKGGYDLGKAIGERSIGAVGAIGRAIKSWWTRGAQVDPEAQHEEPQPEAQHEEPQPEAQHEGGAQKATSFLKNVVPGILVGSSVLYGISELFSTDTAGSDSSDQSHGLMNISPTTLSIISSVAGKGGYDLGRALGERSIGTVGTIGGAIKSWWTRGAQEDLEAQHEEPQPEAQHEEPQPEAQHEEDEPEIIVCN